MAANYNQSDATVATPQYNVTKGLQLFGDKGVQAILSEMKINLLELRVIEPICPSKVTRNIRVKVLNYLMYLKRKQTGAIKGQGCADGRKQREYISKQDSSSPTVSTTALMVTSLINVIQGRCVATVDIAAFFLQTDLPDSEEVWIKFERPMADALVDLDPD